MILWPRKHEAKHLVEPRIMVDPRLIKLETAKEILEEIFQARPSTVVSSFDSLISCHDT